MQHIVADIIGQMHLLGLNSCRFSKEGAISHASRDNDMADIIYSMLLYNNVPAEDILYTSCEDEISRIPEGVSIYKYLRDFFVDSYSIEIYVIFVTSKNNRRGAKNEIGTAWITQVDNKIFNISPLHRNIH